MSSLAPRDSGNGSLTPPRRSDEFPSGASEWPGDISRRRFLEIMAASAALVGLAGCDRRPDKEIVPYVTPPTRELLDAAVYYATAMPWEGYARGILALSQSGRPTKLEGNLIQPDSLGATDAITQAAVLSLYDPDRSRAPRHRSATVAWTAFENLWLEQHAALRKRAGAGLSLLTEPTTSPTTLRAIRRLLEQFPQARWYQHTPLARYDRNGEQPDYDFARADIILSLDADFLGEHPCSLRFGRDWAKRRRIENGNVDASRMYVLEPGSTVTGSVADHRLAVSPARLRVMLTALSALLDGRQPSVAMNERERQILAALAADLRQHAPYVVCVAGDYAGEDVHAWADALNAQLGAVGVTRHALPAVRSDAAEKSAGGLDDLAKGLQSGDVTTLVIAGANPVYTAPPHLDFAALLQRAPLRIHLGQYDDETGAACDWHLPETHFLESWGDLRAYDGTASLVQPLIAPLYATRTADALLMFLAEGLARSDYDLVQETWRTSENTAEFARLWQTWLARGVIDGTANERRRPKTAAKTTGAALPQPAQTDVSEITLLVRPDPTVRDGRFANNAWLQELPKPITQVVWDNPVHVSPAWAAKRQLKDGDVVAIKAPGGTVEAPVLIVPGTADDCLIAHLGYGRRRAGAVGTGLGFSAYGLRGNMVDWQARAESVTATGRRETIVSTHGHYTMEGRDLVRTAKAQRPKATSRPDPGELPSLYPEWRYDSYKWGMLIDLSLCMGCKACVVACQAENNIPVVGKEQVARGRGMHWLRIDRYYEGDPSSPEVLHQPIPCMQCEKAPCELVCPTAATVHSSEGLNDMVYNRCIGTRYCSNNCPYKVRRFNFFNYQPPKDSTVMLQKNPNVSIRARGVMEKCTYCVQRINAARIAAERENRRIGDGEVTTACQQACPTEAIVFGDLNDPKSRVRARKAEPTHYALLEELNTQPRTTYLARLTNKHDGVGATDAGKERT